ncbi:MAG: dihydrofolate reductase [Lachnospiraceae bacterium]|nr:dihydrofolate reductase [Candidatus Darwinimomas equi]
MKEIVNVSKQWGIGKNGDLLINIPGDMKFFRETTKDAVVIMGSTTLESFPGMAPLKNRINIVLIDDPAKIKKESVEAAEADKKAGKKTELIFVRSIEEALKAAEPYPDENVFVIGGATIYRIMLPYCDTCLVTINDCKDKPDVYYPNLEESGEWEMTEEGPENEWEGIHYRFTTWKRK